MTAAALRIITRVIKRRYEAGEDINDILADYPKLTEDEIQQIKDALGIVDEVIEKAEENE